MCSFMRFPDFIVEQQKTPGISPGAFGKLLV
jgi:hypothetical protein